MSFNILRNAVIRNDMGCRHDNNDGWAVVWNENDNFKQYTEVSGVTSTLVWDKAYVAVSTGPTCYISPSSNQSPFEALAYRQVIAYFRIEKNPKSAVVPTTGRIQFQTENDPVYDEDKTLDFPINPDNAYNQYVIDFSAVREWTGKVTRLRLYPFIDGTSGIIIHLKSLRVQSPGVYTCDTSFNGTVCNKFAEYSHPCPWVGSGGSSEAVSISDGIDVINGVNDKLVVDINGYGNQGVTLSPAKGARVADIARDIEEKLSNIAIGGYAGARVDADFNKLKIIADDTRESSSTVVVKDTLAARLLGFYGVDGQRLATEAVGEEAASRYEPSGTTQLSKAEIACLCRQGMETNAEVSLDTGRYALSGGRSDFAITYKDIKIDFTGKTIIDFNNPINGNGIIVSVSYSGDGYSTTEFRVFRPRANGSIIHVHSVSMDIPLAGGVDSLFEKSTFLKVRKGDLLGIYDGRVHSNKIEEVPNRSYFLYDGDLKDGKSIDTPLPVEGRGESGLRLFAHGYDRQSEVVLDIEFDQQQPIEEIRVFAEEEVRTEEINLMHALNGGINGGVHVTALTGVDKFGNVAPGFVNLGSLFDRVKFFGSGALDAHPSWLDTSFEPPDKFDQTEMSLIVDFAKGIPVFFQINRVVLYFKDTDNVKFFSVEYPITADDLDINQYWGSVGNYSDVYMSGKLLEPKDHPFYTNPIRTNLLNFIDGYQVAQFNVLDLRFEAVSARSIRYNVKNYFYEADTTKSTLSNFALAPSPRIMEMEVYAKSIPKASIADNFFFESSADGVNYYLHGFYSDEGETSARYLIGYPVQHIKAHIQPQGKMVVKGFDVSTSLSRATVKTAALRGGVSLNIPTDDFQAVQTVKVGNDTKDTYNYFVNISPQKILAERCLLWNKLNSLETTYVSEIGPSPIVRGRPVYYPREYNYAYLAPAYIVDPFWLLNHDAIAYISYDHGQSWETRGNVLTDYNPGTGLDSVNPNTTEDFDPFTADFIFVYVLVDLGKVYSLDTVQVFGASGRTLFDGPLYSNHNVSNPHLLDIINDFTGVKQETRWLSFRAFAKHESQLDESAFISYIQLSLNPIDGRNKGKLPWSPAPRLTNYVFGPGGAGVPHPQGEGWQTEEDVYTQYYTVDLGDNYRITNILTGPAIDTIGGSDIDTASPGSIGSLYTTTSKSNNSVAYSNSITSDPNKVNWSVFGQEPGSDSRWILIKRTGSVLDEVVVHIEDNDQESKPVFNETRWWSAKYSEVTRDRFEFIEGRHSISVTYPKNNGSLLEELELNQSLGVDHELAKRDQLRLLLYVTDISQLDFSQGYIALGRNTTEDNFGLDPLGDSARDEINYFKWPLSDIRPFLNSGWSEIFLPFTNNFRVGRPRFEEDDLSTLSDGDISSRSRIRWLKIAFAGKSDNSQFDVKVGGIKIFRANYIPGKFGNGLYLSGNEYAKFPLNNFNPLEGTIEFYLTSDWTKDPGCHSCDDSRDHTLFRFFNNEGYVLGLFMTGHGLRGYFSDGIRHYFLTDNTGPNITPGVPVHIAFTWDILGRKSFDGMRIFVNGILSSSFQAEALVSAEMHPVSEVTLMFGGYAWDGILERRVSSVDGVVENVKVHNFAKTDFTHSLLNQDLEHIRPTEDLIEISVDGVNFYGNEDRNHGLPVSVRNVLAGQTFDVYIRRKQNSTGFPDTGLESTVYLEIMRALPG